jgi:hypothetical protein
MLLLLSSQLRKTLEKAKDLVVGDLSVKSSMSNRINALRDERRRHCI